MRRSIVGFAAILLSSGCATESTVRPVNASARDTGTFPVFAVQPAVATRQLGPGEASAEIADLRGDARRASFASRPPRDETERLRRLRRTHEAETLSRIAQQ